MSEPHHERRCDDFLCNTGAILHHAGPVACHRLPPVAAIEMPPVGAYSDSGAYHATVLLRLVDSTGDASRSPRPFGRTIGDADYVREEFVAEMGSAFLCREFWGNGTLQHQDKVLKTDRRAQFRAAAKARKASAFPLGEPKTPLS